MDPRDRFLGCVRGQEVDRVPLCVEALMYRSRDAVRDERDLLKREVVERMFEHTHFFHVVPSGINRHLITPPQRVALVKKEQDADTVTTWSAIDTPKGELSYVVARNSTSRTSWTVKYPVESIEDIEKIRSVPWELPAGTETPALSDLPADFLERGVVRTGISSPFVCVAGMMPYQYFLELCATHFELMRELTQVCFERIMKTLDVLLAKRNIDYVWMGGCEWLTPPMGSPRHYEELVQKFEEPVIRRIHEGDAVCHVHCHGNVRSTIEMVVARGADFFEPVEPPPDGDITFAEAKRLVAGRMTLGGNIEARLLEKADEATVERAVRAAFEGGRHRMVLRNSAGPISDFDERMRRNYHRLVDVWEELSRCEPPQRPATAAAFTAKTGDGDGHGHGVLPQRTPRSQRTAGGSNL
jgi:hypothetical protein